MRSYFGLFCRRANGSDASARRVSEKPTSASSSGHKRATKYETHAEHVSETKLKAQELEDKHGKQYTKEQYIAWANLIEMGHHESLQEPPDKRFFSQALF